MRYPALACPVCQSTRVSKSRQGSIFCEDCRTKTTVGGHGSKMPPEFDLYNGEDPELDPEEEGL